MRVAATVLSSIQGFYLVHSNPRFPDDPSDRKYSGAALECACTQSAVHGCLPHSHLFRQMQGLGTAARRTLPYAGPTMASRSAPALRVLR